MRFIGLSLVFPFFVSLALANGEALQFVDLPKDCFAKKQYPCSVRAAEQVLRFDRGAGSFQLGKGASVKFFEQDQVALLRGVVWIQNAQKLEFVVHPQMKLSLIGEVLIEKHADQNLLVRNINADIKFQSESVFKSEALPVGYQNWYGGLDTRKQIQRGIISPIQAGPFLKSWIPLAGLSAAETKRKIAEFKESWVGNVESSTLFYKEIVERRIASQLELDQQRVNKKKAAELETLKIKKLYRQKAGFLNDSH